MRSIRVSDSLSKCDVYILAGGLGARIQPILGDTPKLLAPVHGRVYIDVLLDWLKRFHVKHTVFGLGHGADAILRNLHDRGVNDMWVETIVETTPLGTAGALRLARARLQSDPVLVMNGDSLVKADLTKFLSFHLSVKARGTILCAEVDDGSRFGRIELDETRITRFIEKDPGFRGKALVSAGVYLLSASLMDEIAAGDSYSLEYDVFAKLPVGSLAGYVGGCHFIDIGTPEALKLVN